MDQFRDWLRDHGIAIVSIAVAAYIVVHMLRRAIPSGITRVVMRQATPLTETDVRKRAETLSSVLLGSAEIAVLVVALLLVIDQLGVNVAPVIAGLGIGGIAIGLGAQSLVRDAINGILILTENQYGKGDMIRVAGVQGWVEEVNLRRTVLRDADGTLHSVPNSEVRVSSNLTRGFSGIDLLVPLAAGTDVDAAIDLIDRTAQELAADESTGPKVIDTPRVARVEATSAASVTVRVTGRVVPGAQWEVTGALRRRLVRAFGQAEIKFGPIEGAPPPPAPPAAPR